MVTLLICLQLILLAKAGKIVQLENGNHVITGRGCGISTPLKYLLEIPADPENHECVIIQPPNNIVTKSTKDSEYFLKQD